MAEAWFDFYVCNECNTDFAIKQEHNDAPTDERVCPKCEGNNTSLLWDAIIDY